VKTTVLVATLLAGNAVVQAKAQVSYQGITCETVREFVRLVGTVRALAIARAHGMTRHQERKARRCLARNG
jgi:hypothetical protein